MSMNTTTMIDELYEHLGIDSSYTNFGEPVALLLLNRAFWEILNKFEFREKEKQYNFTTVAGQAEYTVPVDFEAIQSIGILDNQLPQQYHKLQRKGINFYQDNLIVNPLNQQNIRPSVYFRRDDKIVLWDTPKEEYLCTVYNLINLEDLEDNDDIPIPREWDELIMLGGIYRGFLRLGDIDRANYFKNIQTGLINSTVPVESKEEIDSSMAGVGLPKQYYNRRRLWR